MLKDGQTLNSYILSEPPEILYLRLTHKCNLNCMYCCQDSKHYGPLMDLRIVKKALKEAKEYGVKLIHLDGGEPLLHPRFLNIIDLIVKHDFLVGIATNSTLLTKNVIAKLSDINLNQILTNIDGREALHNKLRGSHLAFKRTIKALSILKEFDLLRKTVIATVLTKLNYKEIPQIIEMVERDYKGIREYRIITLIPIKRGGDHKGVLLMEKYDWMTFIYGTLPKILSRKIGVKISFSQMLLFQVLKNVRFSNGSIEEVLPLIMDKIRGLKGVFGCEGGERIMIIDVDGRALPCPHLPDLSTSLTIERTSLELLWNSEVFKAFRKNKYSLPIECRDCIFSDFCKGGCQAYKYASGVNLEERDPRCKIFEEIRRELKDGTRIEHPGNRDNQCL